MGKREETALAVLAAGGYFRKALERHFHGGEKFKMRLRAAGGAVVPGIGFATFYALKEAGKLAWRPCAKSSVWPEEWVLAKKEGA